MALIFCFLPLILLVLIFTFGFKIKFTHQLITILLGLLAVFPISIIQYFAPEFLALQRYPIFYSLLKSIILYGFVEEIFKMAFEFAIPHKNHTCFEFLLLAFTFGISLGCFESVVYFLDHLQIANSRGAQLLYTQIFARICTSDLIHMACAGLSGLFVYTVRQKHTRPSFLILAILLHGIYDYFAVSPTFLRYFSIAVVLLSLAECRIKYVSLQNDVD